MSKHWFDIGLSAKCSDDNVNCFLCILLPRYIGQEFEIRCWHYSGLLSFPSPPITVLCQACVKYWARERGNDILQLPNTAKYNCNSHVKGCFLNVYIFVCVFPKILPCTPSSKLNFSFHFQSLLMSFIVYFNVRLIFPNPELSRWFLAHKFSMVFHDSKKCSFLMLSIKILPNLAQNYS